MKHIITSPITLTLNTILYVHDRQNVKIKHWDEKEIGEGREHWEWTCQPYNEYTSIVFQWQSKDLDKQCDGREGWTWNEHVNTYYVSLTINSVILYVHGSKRFFLNLEMGDKQGRGEKQRRGWIILSLTISAWQ